MKLKIQSICMILYYFNKIIYYMHTLNIYYIAYTDYKYVIVE